jgi:4-aminobutyrate aminotransferase-like enzyme/Ser/Thr protein kinase RdoA (MazF antagonist)
MTGATGSRRAPRLATAWAEQLAGEAFGVAVRARPLGSYADQNFELTDERGRRYVLKLSAEDVPAGLFETQHRAMHHLGDQASGLAGVAVPAPVLATDGREIVDVETDRGHVTARMLSFVEGEPVRQLGWLSAELLRELGSLAGTTARLLGGLDADGAPAGEWDLRDAGAMLAESAPLVADPELAQLARRAASRAEAALVPLRPSLREGLIHADLTDENVLFACGEDGRLRPSGVIDFGDLCPSWLVAELAVLASACLGRQPSVHTLVELVRGFHFELSLREEEADALVPLIVLRAAAGAVQTDLRAAADPDNTHLAAAVAWEWATFDAVHGLSPIARAAVRRACGFAPSTAALAAGSVPTGGAPLVDGLGSATPLVDLSARTDALAFGAWRDHGAVADAIARERRDGLAVGRYGEARLVYDAGVEDEEPATLHLGVDVFAAAATTVRAPLAGRVQRHDGDGLVLAHGPWYIHLRGLEPSLPEGAEVAVGDSLGTIREPDGTGMLPAHVHVQLCCERIDDLPARAPASLGDAWRGVCPDPSGLLGLAAAAPVERPEAALERRLRVIASPQEHYYAAPPEIVRGWRQWLYDSQARPYLDVVNNVAVLGHSHPRVAEAAARQMRLLNTNSRFVYGSMTRFAEALLEVVPDPLDAVFLVSSGSEANDLALQLVRHATGRDEVIALEGAYHGWTGTPFSLSTHLLSNPTGRLGDGATTVPSPFAERTPGQAGGNPAAARHVRAAIDALEAEGRGVAGFVCEAFSGVSGGVPLPDGYLRDVYAAVRGAGGLCVADEVQAGYGRLGAHFWAFEQQGVVPDVVSIAKSTGNGHPVAAVITRREIADAFAAHAPWFSSVGGGPVSCEVGLAVLRALQEERLQQNALEVGAHLRAALEQLVPRHPICGAVHGMGLYLGVELVRDPVMWEPAAEDALAICERMLGLGVIVQPTGDHDNILKIKPPLVVTREDADLLVERLDRVLATGWR